jgi:hypothetical protein
MAQVILVFLLGLGLFLVGFFQIRKSLASRSWAGANGTITAAKIEVDQAAASDEDSAAILFIAIEYRYEVNGQTHIGKRIRFDQKRYGSKKQAQTALSKYTVGGPVQVFYDPQHPDHCILEQGNTTGWVFAAVGTVMILLALASLFK